MTLYSASIPDGESIECQSLPALTKAHDSRLRKLWSLGRPMQVSELDGVDLDLVVHGLAQTIDNGYSPCATLSVTKLGVAYLNETRQSMVRAQKNHHALGNRLAAHLQSKGMWTWENVEFSNPDWSSPRTWGVVRPDVFACLPSLRAANSAPAIYEVKVSRADFLADLAKPTKREAYSQISEAVYYCCPTGLIDKDEVPDGYGLLAEVTPGQFALQKKARRQKSFVLDVNTVMTLMVKRQVPLSSNTDGN